MKPIFLLLIFLVHILTTIVLVRSKLALVIIVFVPYLGLYFFKTLWLNPWKIKRKLESQGIKGPKPSFLYGNVWEMQKINEAVAMKKMSSSANINHDQEFMAHDYTSTLFPYFEQWRKQYGPIYTYSTGIKQHLYVNNPELVKEMNHCTSSELGKPSYITKRLAPMLGNGILRSNGHIWALQRKIVAREFFMDKVKVILSC